MESNWIGYVDTLLEYYLHICPHELSDEEWAVKFKQVMDIRKKECG